jgi:hypothetical protein
MQIPPRLDNVTIPESETLETAWRTLTVVCLADLSTAFIEHGVKRSELGSSYGCINVEYDLEVLRRMQDWFCARIVELRNEINQNPK